MKVLVTLVVIGALYFVANIMYMVMTIANRVSH
jgi:hypothetical protein